MNEKQIDVSCAAQQWIARKERACQVNSQQAVIASLALVYGITGDLVELGGCNPHSILILISLGFQGKFLLERW